MENYSVPSTTLHQAASWGTRETKMATYMDVDKVQYLTSTGVKAPLCRLYFCRHCVQLRSGDCVSHEVDSHYCPNCLENMPSAEAKLKKNRCAGCFDCPSCRHTLSTRATSIAIPHPEDPAKSTPKKVYYLACGFCRWTSRDAGIKDQLVASGAWPEQQNTHLKRISTLLDHYRQLAQREKAEKDKKKLSRRRNYLHYTREESQLSPDKFGLSSAVSRRRSGLMGMGGLSLKENEELKISDIPAGETVTELEPLDESVYNTAVSLTNMTGLAQRHANAEFQPILTSELYPRHKHLLIKRSQRCRECEHNLSKPEYNPSSIKFKIQLVALHHVPEIRIMAQPNLVYQKETQVILTLFNPLDSLTHVTLLPHDEVEGSLGDSASLVLPQSQLVLAPRDDAAEFDDGSDSAHNFNDDPSVVVFRNANKIGFFIKVTPQTESGDVCLSFIMKYDYRNMTTALQTDTKEPEVVWLEHPVYINLGPVHGSESYA